MAKPPYHLFILSEFLPGLGGAEQMTYRLAMKFHAQGQPVLIVASDRGGFVPHRAEPSGRSATPRPLNLTDCEDFSGFFVIRRLVCCIRCDAPSFGRITLGH